MRVRVLLVVLGLLAGACGGDEAAGPQPSPTGPQSFDSLQEAAAAFDCSDVRDVGTGGNAGLKAFGVCHIGRANIDIYLTTDRSLWEHIAEQFPAVLGPNWVIVCPTGPKAARIVHERLGGELKIPKPTPRPGTG